MLSKHSCDLLRKAKFNALLLVLAELMVLQLLAILLL
jgi:hypothetical protein